MTSLVEQAKEKAARAAVDNHVVDGMVVGVVRSHFMSPMPLHAHVH